MNTNRVSLKRNRQLNMDNYDGLIRYFWVWRQIQLNGYQYRTTELNKKYHTGQQSKLKNVKIYHAKLYRGVVSLKTTEHNKQVLD